MTGKTHSAPLNPPSPPRPARLSRADRTPLGVWLWEIDRVLLTLVVLLIALGLVAVAAASPASAQKLSTSTVTLDPLYFFFRQLGWVAVGVPLMLVMSMLSRPQVRQLAVGATLVFLLALFLVPLVGTEVNGAQRWLGSGMARLQPSEFLKPFFAVSVAWLLAVRFQDPGLPVLSLSFVLTGIIALLLMGQPDLGQTVIFCATWLILALLAGLSLRWFGAMVGAAAGGIGMAYVFYPVATQRINMWLLDEGDKFQIDKAHATLSAGGMVGTGPGAGMAKFALPEAHTDYVFSVIGEELGLVTCMVIAAIYLAIVVRVLLRLLEESDGFAALASAALVLQFGGQAAINIGVNAQLLPSKGMTLPFISYGGSSFIALSLGMGLLLALTRRNPYAAEVTSGGGWARPGGAGGRSRRPKMAGPGGRR